MRRKPFQAPRLIEVASLMTLTRFSVGVSGVGDNLGDRDT
jgi:hypothetical protein